MTAERKKKLQGDAHDCLKAVERAKSKVCRSDSLPALATDGSSSLLSVCLCVFVLFLSLSLCLSLLAARRRDRQHDLCEEEMGALCWSSWFAQSCEQEAV
jgi:hypothetical protein